MATNSTGLSFAAVNSEERRSAELSNSISNGLSPFYDGLVFRLVFRSDDPDTHPDGGSDTLPIDEWAIAHDYRRPVHDGVVDTKARLLPVLTTTAGDIFLSMLFKARVDFEGNRIEPAGNFNVLVQELIRTHHGESDRDILRLIEQAVLDTPLTIRGEDYNAPGYEGRPQPKTMCHISYDPEKVVARRAELEQQRQERDSAATPNNG